MFKQYFCLYDLQSRLHVIFIFVNKIYAQTSKSQDTFLVYGYHTYLA